MQTHTGAPCALANLSNRKVGNGPESCEPSEGDVADIALWSVGGLQRMRAEAEQLAAEITAEARQAQARSEPQRAARYSQWASRLRGAVAATRRAA